MIKNLILKNRSYRRFHQQRAIKPETLKDLIDLARFSASAKNLQPLKYVLSCNSQRNAVILPNLGWAGYLKDWSGPVEGERPSAYIIILEDTKIIRSSYSDCDVGIAAQSILLGATEKGLGGCMIGSIRKEKLRQKLHIHKRYKIKLVIALGVPKEQVVINPVGSDGDIKYWRDSKGIHHVPKRSLDDVIIG